MVLATEEAGFTPSYEVSREAFNRRLKPVVEATKKAESLRDTLEEYESSLNLAVNAKSLDDDTLNAVMFVTGNKRAIKIQVTSPEQVDDSGKIVDLKVAEKLRQENIRKVFHWFSKQSPNIHGLLSRYIQDKSSQNQDSLEQQLEDLIGLNVCHFITANKTMAKAYRRRLEQGGRVRYFSDIEQRQLKDMAIFLTENSSELAPLRGKTKTEGSAEPGFARGQITFENHLVEDDINAFLLPLKIEAAVLRLNPELSLFELREWFNTTAKEARMGSKIYDTPYYQDLLLLLVLESKKKNGVGGVILYGPPGTGKTELLQEKNKRLGFATRVVSMHHYMSFEELIGAKAIALGLDQGASFAQKLGAVVEKYEKVGAEDFRDDFLALTATLKSEGGIGEGGAAEDILALLVDPKARDLLQKQELTIEDWGQIKESFIRNQRGRILRTALPASFQERVKDFIKGEILLAIEKGERVALDEIEKSGMNSLGGLLGFLAKSPGDRFKIADTDQEIPDWFTIDATSNNMLILDDFLKNRFSHVGVSTPPAKDQLMIAGVRVADSEGNILLSDYEQRQLVGLFLYVVPGVNEILQTENIAPLSNRDIQLLGNYLVDFNNRKRRRDILGFKDISVGQAVRMVLLENKNWGSGVQGKIKGLLQNFDEMLSRPAAEESLEPEFSNPLFLPKKARRKAWEHDLKKVIESPMAVAINGLPEEPSSIHMVSSQRIILNPHQRAAVRGALNAKKSKLLAPDFLELPIGLQFSGYRDKDQRYILNLGATPAEGREQVFAWQEIADQERVIDLKGASADGQVVVYIESSVEEQAGKVGDVRAAVCKDGRFKVRHSLGDYPRDSEVIMDDSGRRICILNKENHHLDVFTKSEDGKWEKRKQVSLIKKADIRGDGKNLLAEYTDGTTSLIDLDSPQEDRYLDGSSWKFAGNNLVVQEEDGSIAPEAYLVI